MECAGVKTTRKSIHMNLIPIGKFGFLLEGMLFNSERAMEIQGTRNEKEQPE